MSGADRDRPHADGTEPTTGPGLSVEVVRLTTFAARPGQIDALLRAAGRNASSARQTEGCRSAEVCVAPESPDSVLVVSRWASARVLRAFLDWHEGLAHGSVSPYTLGGPQSVHYAVITGPP